MLNESIWVTIIKEEIDVEGTIEFWIEVEDQDGLIAEDLNSYGYVCEEDANSYIQNVLEDQLGYIVEEIHLKDLT